MERPPADQKKKMAKGGEEKREKIRNKLLTPLERGPTLRILCQTRSPFEKKLHKCQRVPASAMNIKREGPQTGVWGENIQPLGKKKSILDE